MSNHTTGAQRRNAKMHAIFERAEKEQGGKEKMAKNMFSSKAKALSKAKGLTKKDYYKDTGSEGRQFK